MSKTFFQYCLVLFGSYFLSYYFFPVKELSEKDKKRLPPIEDKKKPIEDGKRDLEPQPPSGLFVRSGSSNEMPPGSQQVIEKLLEEATKKRSYRTALATFVISILFREYKVIVTTAKYSSYKESIKRMVAGTASTLYNATNTGLYNSYSSDETIIQKVFNVFRKKKPNLPGNGKTPFDVKLTPKQHVKILRRYVWKLIKMEVPGETIRWIIFLIGIIVGLLSSGLITYSAGIGALVDAITGSENLNGAAQEVILELFYEMVEDDEELVNP